MSQCKIQQKFKGTTLSMVIITYHYLLTIVKNCEVSDILPYVQASESACRSIVDVGRRGETPESETKGVLLFTAIALARVSAFMVVC